MHYVKRKQEYEVVFLFKKKKARLTSPPGILLNRQMIAICYFWLKQLKKDQSLPETEIQGLRAVGIRYNQRAEVNSQTAVEFPLLSPGYSCYIITLLH